jgi:hypothetical protein
MITVNATADATDVLSVEVLHPLEEPPRFFRRLQQTVVRATVMRGAVAFWTVKPNFVVQDFAKLVAANQSFICVDLHQPTSVEIVDELIHEVEKIDSSKRHVFLYLRELEGQTEVWQANSNMPESLLHLKALLFDFNDETAEIWIGSHNWTRRAMIGLNLEATLVLRVGQESQLYQNTKNMLEATRDLCEPFDTRLKKYYKRLQGAVQPAVFFELEGPNAGKLARQEIKFFSTVEGEFASFRTIGRHIYLAVTDTQTGVEYIYNAAITTASDSTNDINSLATSLSSRKQRFAVRQDGRLPHLNMPPEAATVNPAEKATYCATIRIDERLPKSIRVFDPETRDPWVVTSDDPLLERLRQANVDFLMRVSPEYSSSIVEILGKIKMKVPASAAQERLRRPQTRTLAEKRASSEHALFTPKFVEIPPKKSHKKSGA